jgi:hypothetical protein
VSVAVSVWMGGRAVATSILFIFRFFRMLELLKILIRQLEDASNIIFKFSSQHNMTDEYLLKCNDIQEFHLTR